MSEPPKYEPRIAAAYESYSDLIIGIDFGTTFTGVAFSHSTGENIDVGRVAEGIKIVRTWPSSNLQYTEKTPTVIAYNKDPPIWGGNVKPKDKPQVSHFKLGLQANVGKHYLRKWSIEDSSMILGGFLKNHNWKHPDLPNKKALDFTSDYLTCVVNYINTEILPNEFGSNFLRNQQISFVITVPAIWTDAAKALTRTAALRAGIPGHKLEFITEPEAAALCYAATYKELDLHDGDRFLVCDAGGGTVDLISYHVITREPFAIEECSVGTGAACGSVYLDNGFEKLLRKKLGANSSLLKEKRLEGAMEHFENHIKRQFNPLDKNCSDTYEVPFAGAPDAPDIGLEDGYLTVSQDEIQSVYRPIFDQILALAKAQILEVENKCKAKMKTILLVGGLGSNQYLRDFLKLKLQTSIAIKQPISGYTSIVRGAVLYKMGLNIVKERLMRRNYGVYGDIIFNPGHHPKDRKYVDLAGVDRCRGTILWYAYKGERMTNGNVVEKAFQPLHLATEYEAPGKLESSVRLMVCEDDVPPEYECSSIRELCRLTVNLRDLPKTAFSNDIGPQGKYYSVRYDVGIIFGPEMIFQLRYQGKVMGSAIAKYL